ncbi:MAG: hypothetical protein P4L71_01895 [Acetobacteraceae bacterium]|nr:hypothetical protein [Acetobacteraceae bacterium]
MTAIENDDIAVVPDVLDQRSELIMAEPADLTSHSSSLKPIETEAELQRVLQQILAEFGPTDAMAMVRRWQEQQGRRKTLAQPHEDPLRPFNVSVEYQERLHYKATVTVYARTGRDAADRIKTKISSQKLPFDNPKAWDKGPYVFKVTDSAGPTFCWEEE